MIARGGRSHGASGGAVGALRQNYVDVRSVETDRPIDGLDIGGGARVAAQHAQAIGDAAVKQLTGGEADAEAVGQLGIDARFARKDFWVHHLGPAAGG